MTCCRRTIPLCTWAARIASANISWCPDHARTDTNTADLRSGVLFPYNTSVAIYHCPADKSTVETADGQPTTQLRNRSYNMSQSVNGYPEYLMGLDMPGLSDIPFWKKFTEIRRPIPSQLFVFIDEHPDTLFDAQFGNPAGSAVLGADVVRHARRPPQPGRLLLLCRRPRRTLALEVPMTFQYLGNFPPAIRCPIIFASRAP